MSEKPAVTLPANVKKIIPPTQQIATEKAEIHVKGADPLYEEIRIPNSLKDNSGNEVRLKEGAQVEVKVEAEPHGTVSKH